MKTKNRTLIEQIYDGNFLPTEHIQPQDPDYLPTCREAEKEYRYIYELLSDDDQKHFKRLLDLNLNMGAMDSCACFSRGFQYGALLMLEIMEAKDSLLACP